MNPSEADTAAQRRGPHAASGSDGLDCLRTNGNVAHPGELLRSRLAPILELIYRLVNGRRRWRVTRVIFYLLQRLEGGAARSATVRKLLERDFQVVIGAYSYGEAFNPGVFPPTVIIGRYVSIATGVRVYTQNHPLDSFSTHPLFYDSGFGVAATDKLKPSVLVIGHDAWLGANCLILPNCHTIGVGAVIGAGAVVTKDVPDFAVVAGVPAKVLRYRFAEPARARILASRWWLENPQTIRSALETQLNFPLEQSSASEAPPELKAVAAGATSNR